MYTRALAMGGKKGRAEKKKGPGRAEECIGEK